MNLFLKVKILTLCGTALLLSACIRTEPRLIAPHINLSPETVFTDKVESGEVVDFGIEVTGNESDSLENLEVLPGVRVRRVDNNGSAAAAELKAGDIILAVNAVDTNHPDTFTTLLQNSEAGQPVNLTVRRDTTVFDTTMVGQTRARPNIQERHRADPIMSRAGYVTVQVHANGQTLTGARIAEVFNKSPLPKAGLKVDDIIITANAYAVESAQGLVNYLMSLNPSDKVVVQALRDEQLMTKQLRLWDPGRRLSRFSLWPLFSYESGLSPSTTQFSVLDLWIVSLFKYRRQNAEKNYQILTLFEYGTGAGELVEGAESSQ